MIITLLHVYMFQFFYRTLLSVHDAISNHRYAEISGFHRVERHFNLNTDELSYENLQYHPEFNSGPSLDTIKQGGDTESKPVPIIRGSERQMG